MANVTFLVQLDPMDDYGRALFAVARSILRALVDQLSAEDLADIDCDRVDVTLRQLSKLSRLERDKGMRGDGFEWAVHEALQGGEERICGIVQAAMERASPRVFAATAAPKSLLFGCERARYLGFLDAVVQGAGEGAVLIPDALQGRPFYFDRWVTVAARGIDSEPELAERIKKVWKTDLFLGDSDRLRYVAATVKSNWHHLEAGPGLRLGIVPEARDLPAGTAEVNGLSLAVLPDPDGFMGLFNDAYAAVAAAIYTLGRHDRPAYFLKPSAKAQRLQEQLERYPTATVLDITDELDKGAQRNLVSVDPPKLVTVDAPPWLFLPEARIPIVAPKPRFEPV